MTFKRTLIIIAILVSTAGLTFYVSQSEKIAPNKPFDEFPLEIDRWNGKKGELDQRIYNTLGVEDYILGNYYNSQGEVVNLYVGFYQSQKEGDIIHSPKNCMPGAGWNIIESGTIPVDLGPTVSEKSKVIKLLLAKGGQRQVVLYWFQSRGRIIASEYMQKIWLVVDSIIKNRTDGSFVRLIAPVTVDEKTTVDLLKKFAVKVYPILNEYIPS